MIWKTVQKKDCIIAHKGSDIIAARKSGNMWWVDYSKFDIGHNAFTSIGTLKPVKTKEQALKSIELAKKEFVM